jgi:hypothetical protein
MNQNQTPQRGIPKTIKGRTLGLVVLVGLQLLIGIIHLFAGLLLLAYEDFSALLPTSAYNIYTFVFGLLVVSFSYGIWLGRRWGWLGTIAVSVFVIIADSTALLNVPFVQGTPQGPAAVEIPYSLILICYLFLGKVRKRFV